MMKKYLFPLLVMLMAASNPVGAAERHMIQPRVPTDKLAEARALTSPLLDSPQVIEQAKRLPRQGHLLHMSWSGGRRQGVGGPS